MLTLEFWCLPVVGGGVLILKNSAYLLNKVHKVWYRSFVLLRIGSKTLRDLARLKG